MDRPRSSKLITFLPIVLFVALILFSHPARAQQLSEVDWSNIKVNFTKVEESLNKQIFYFYIQQNYSNKGIKMDLGTLINETNFPTSKLEDIRMWTRENKTYQDRVVDHYDNITYNETVYSNQTGQNETVTEWRLEPVYKNVTKAHWIWEEAKQFYFKDEKDKVSGYAGTITIPDLSDVDEMGRSGSKMFKVAVDTPIVETSGGWGSSGLFAVNLTDNSSSKIIHPWWNSSWARYRNLTFTEQSGNDLTNYPVETTLYIEDDKVQTDCDDVRPIAPNEKEIEFNSTCNSGYNTTHTQVNLTYKINVSASSTVDYSVYYDNPDAAQSAKEVKWGEARYNLWDDFEDGTVAPEWYIQDGTATRGNNYGSLSESDGYLNITAYDYNDEVDYEKTYSYLNHSFLARRKFIKTDATNNDGSGLTVETNYTLGSLDLYSVAWGGQEKNNDRFITWVEGSWHNLWDVSFSWNLGGTYISTLRRPNNATLYRDLKNATFSVTRTAKNVTHADNNYYGITANAPSTGYHNHLTDWWGVREYVLPEPTYTVGPEQTLNKAPNQPTLNSPSDGATKLSLSPILNVTVTDPDGDDMNVTFYDNTSGTPTQIGADNLIPNGSQATYQWSGRTEGNTYKWFVQVMDNQSSAVNSSEWSFTANSLWLNLKDSEKSFRVNETIKINQDNFTLGGEPYTFIGMNTYIWSIMRRMRLMMMTEHITNSRNT